MGTLKVCAVVLMGPAAFGACGGADDAQQPPTVSSQQRAILNTIEGLQAASRGGDAEKICTEIFTEHLAQSIRKASNRSCEKEVRGTLTSPDADISVRRQITIRGSRATAVVREQDGNNSRIFLVKQGDRWRIERIKPVES